MKLVKKICIWGFSILTLIAFLAIGIVHIYEDEVKAYALEEIAKALKTDVKVSSVNLTLLDQFPSASLQFNDVLLEETFEEKDTLLYAEYLYLNFSVYDLISGNYEVNEVAITDSKLFLKRKKNGEDNFHFWRESEGGSPHFKVLIDQVNISQSKIYYNDLASNTDLALTANDCQVNAHITDKSLEFTGDIDTQTHNLSVGKQNYLDDKSINGSISLTIDLHNNLYTFNDTKLKINDLPIEISGNMDLSKNITQLNLNAKTNGARLNHLVSVLPSFVRKNLNGFETSGKLNCDLRIKGTAGDGFVPDFVSTYSISGAQIENLDSGVSLNGIQVSGSYSAPFKKEDLLTISNFRCTLGGDEIIGSGKISRLSNPFINAETQGNIDLENLNELFGFKEIEELEGRANIALNYKGNLGKDWQPSVSNLNHADLSGKVNVQNGVLKLSYNNHEFQDISGELIFNKSVATVTELKANLESSDFTFNGKFSNVLGYLLLPNENLKITSSFSSNHLDLNSLLSSSSSDSSVDYEFNLPSNIDLSLNTSVKSLEFRKFNAFNISAQAEVNSKALKLRKLNMELAQGTIHGDLSASQNQQGIYSLISNGNVQQVNISDLFSNFEDFQQEFITHKHIKGKATSNFSFSAHMTSGLNLVSESINVDADITLVNGELINHSTLQEIGQYVKDKRLIGSFMNVNDFQNKLNHVHFSELKNQIKITNSVITIPKMSIESDALNIIAEGNHSFDNQIDYSVGFDIADLTKRDGLAEDEKGLSKNIFISMTGNTDSPVFSYDRLAVKGQRQENRKEEVLKIRELVRQEFSGKNEEPESISKNPSEPKMEIDWSDKESKKTTQKPKKIIFLEPDSEPVEEEEDDDF